MANALFNKKAISWAVCIARSIMGGHRVAGRGLLIIRGEVEQHAGPKGPV